MEREFIMIKPDGVQRGLVGDVVKRIENVGFKIIGMKLLKVSLKQAEQHYAIHKEQPFYDDLLGHITCGPVVAMVVEGKDAVRVTRKIVGATNPIDAVPGSIRGDFALEIGRNIIHAGDSPENAIYEYKIYFNEEEFVKYNKIDERWLYE